jgi:hypothetical protein
MAKILTHHDGRLRTGRVTFLVFAGLLAALSLLFKANSSVDQAVLSVKHVFEPTPVAPKKNRYAVKQDSATKETPNPEPEVAMKAKPAHDDKESEESAAEPAGSRQDENPITSHQIQKPASPDSLFDVQAKRDAADVPEPEAAPVPQEAPAPIKAFAEAPHNSDLMPEDVTAVQDVPSPDVPSPEASEEMANDPGPGFDKAALERLSLLGKTASQTKVASGSGRIDISDKLAQLTVDQAKPSAASVPEKDETEKASAASGHVKADPRTGEVTVDQKQYMTLFKSWHAAGNGSATTEKIPLRVQNLRESYELFQMKVIAVVRGNTLLDLADGARVSEAALAEYCTTLFLVDRPWDKWAEALTSAGIRHGEQVEVRYYMYDFVKRAIYARVNQAVSWCRDNGLVAKDLPAASMDVLGRAYVINRQGGGRFGVFVPVSVETTDGKTVAVDPACFRGQADVEALHVAGLL